MQNNIKNSSLNFNYGGLTLNSNSFVNNSNIINFDYCNNINLTDDPQKYNHFNENIEKISKLTNSLSEAQILKRLNKIKNVEKNAPILHLVVLSSNYYKAGKRFKIGPYGLINNNKNVNIDKNKARRFSYKNNNEDDFSNCSKKKNDIGIVYFGYFPVKINNQKNKNENILLDNSNNHNKLNKLSKNIKNKNNKKTNQNKEKEKEKENIIYFSNNNDNSDYIDIQVPPWEEDKEKEKITQISTNVNTNLNLNISNTLENKKYGRYFYIYFNPDYMKYYIRDCGMSYATFIKIQNEIILKDNYVINIGDTYLKISIGIENKYFLNSQKNNGFNLKNKKISISDSDYNNNLNLKILSRDKIYDPVNFPPTKSKIKIGRASNCEIIIDDILLSRVHCTIEYKNNIGWIIRDGYNNKENMEESMDIKSSTNGTWLYAFEDTPIYEGMILRSDNNLFRCKF